MGAITKGKWIWGFFGLVRLRLALEGRRGFGSGGGAVPNGAARLECVDELCAGARVWAWWGLVGPSAAWRKRPRSGERDFGAERVSSRNTARAFPR